jgi:hypothetical protein
MKIIALMPVKNEAWILRTTLPSLTQIADETIALVADSEDDSKKRIESQGGIALDQDNRTVQYSTWRQTLLDEGRKRGGTHFIWLDADEAFTAPLLPNLKNRIAQLKPGQKLVMDWISVWKNPHQMRCDGVFGQLYKDFIFCDDRIGSFPKINLHEGRTPGANGPDQWVRIPREEGAVLHFQAVSFKRFQIKQAFMRCREFLLKTGPAWEINQKYALTNDGPATQCAPIPETWLEGLPHLDALSNQESGHYLAPLLAYFKQYGMARFEPMDIWHIEELKQQFIRTTGKEPAPSIWPSFPKRLASHYFYAVRRRLPVFK